jgi:hypothetical protein
MEITRKKVVVVKLDQEEREPLIATILLLEELYNKVHCVECPFKERCNTVSKDGCLLYALSRDLKYINNNCD